jgi:rare lipoprotein A
VHGTDRGLLVVAGVHRSKRTPFILVAVNYLSSQRLFRHIGSALIISFALLTASSAVAEDGLASYYGGRGHRGDMTCAHRTRAFGSLVTVTYAGRSIRCRVNDRGPFVRGRVIDVSLSAARAFGIMRSGVVLVSVE